MCPINFINLTLYLVCALLKLHHLHQRSLDHIHVTCQPTFHLFWSDLWHIWNWHKEIEWGKTTHTIHLAWLTIQIKMQRIPLSQSGSLLLAQTSWSCCREEMFWRCQFLAGSIWSDNLSMSTADFWQSLKTNACFCSIIRNTDLWKLAEH